MLSDIAYITMHILQSLGFQYNQIQTSKFSSTSSSMTSISLFAVCPNLRTKNFIKSLQHQFSNRGNLAACKRKKQKYTNLGPRHQPLKKLI